MTTLRFEQALLPDGWSSDVAVEINDNGDIAAVHPASSDGEPRPGCLLPGIANLHSHAHQRAMAGLAERAGASDDSFWTWRETMYRFLDTIEPEHLEAIAAQLYVEMLKAGYTRVAEFQYLHHQSNGQQYDELAEMSLRTLAAANAVGLGITNLPVHYQFGGFGGQPISDQQRRFTNDPQHFLQIVDSLMSAGADNPNVTTGIAAHSLRAVTKATFTEVLDEMSRGDLGPVHIHIAEQTKEVEDCVAWSSVRPVEYLYNHFAVNEHWCLIHATHMTEAETTQVANSRAVVGLCPTTEGNLGDGFFNAVEYMDQNGRFGIGSDSHISISPCEELRWYEYGQRLLHRRRNRLSGGYSRSTGRNLFECAVAGGAQACGHLSGKIEAGYRADFLVLDLDHPLLCERNGDEIIDSWLFSGNQNTVRDVYVGGKQVIRE
ncbi:MAG: formimidoylglutamate deiminase, partial [Gammaproteobacteria bacterium]|nr:formimidoylglutamate deiminase [Gammaproteobacteria bacterium]